MGYRETVLIPAESDPTHPVYYGVKVQVHHLLSKNGLDLSGKGEKLKSYGYDINTKGNLVGLPCELDAACYLRVQVHRGNHPSFVLNIDDNDDDDNHPESYHVHISRMIRSAAKKLEGKCGVNDEKKVTRYMNGWSKLVLAKIADFEIPLTKHFRAFHKDGSGCGGETSGPTLYEKLEAGSAKVCDRDVDHAKYSDFTNIPYKLKQGK